MPRTIRVFAYTVTFPQGYSASVLRRRFTRARISENVIPFWGDYLLLIIDNVQGNLVYARLLKLRSDRPSIINRRTRRERDLRLDLDENIKEESHFLLNLRDNIIFGEYNYYAARHLSHPLMFYFNTIFSSEDFDIRPIPDPSTFDRMQRERRIKEVTLSIAQEGLSNQEQRRGVPILGALFGLSNNNTATLKITISKGFTRDNELNRNRILSLAREFRDRGDVLYSLIVVGENSKYDLLNGDLVSYNLTVNEVNGKVSTSDFNRRVIGLYNGNIASIMALLPRR